ncbi:putative inactive kinesin-like protein KIN-7B isoform X2 [Capsicum annuum]|uniref:putative inactive kinesin-like protein KIN-7B isoform X2 n=1 Tax=Capsicum annuum TaxID=4072 RepID=UPI001FB0D988|nr:putative inactive kinesin-like protein KIN-7B isoform X2 [Capsicum annuum]
MKFQIGSVLMRSPSYIGTAFRNGLDCQQLIQSTIESSACEFIGKDNKTTLSASMNFIDLAGSERASHALSDGKRLKEGCHINHSLLTLETVIHKLRLIAYFLHHLSKTSRFTAA